MIERIRAIGLLALTALAVIGCRGKDMDAKNNGETIESIRIRFSGFSKSKSGAT